jgi:hypothetical protein
MLPWDVPELRFGQQIREVSVVLLREGDGGCQITGKGSA